MHKRGSADLKTILFKSFLILSSFAFTACAPSSTGSLISDAVTVTDCPENSCAQGVADLAETKLQATSSSTVFMPAGVSLAEVAGECYPSLYPDSRIVVTVIQPNGAVLNKADLLPAGYVPKCKEGKFYLPLNFQLAAGRLAAGVYTVSVELRVINSLGQELIPPFKNFSSFYTYP